jgi:hypothetical protein
VSDKFLRWYGARSTRDTFIEQADSFERSGIYIRHPATGMEVMLDVDGNGVSVEPNEVAHLIDLKLGSVNVEFWVTPDVSLTCLFSWIPLGLEIQAFYLDGLPGVELAHVKSVLLGYVSSAPGTFGYVLDLDGDTAEYDWDSFFDAIHMGDPPPVDVYPELLVIKGSPVKKSNVFDAPSFVEVRKLHGDFVQFSNLSKGTHSQG